MVTADTKLYVQLEPDAAGKSLLSAVQKTLGYDANLVATSALHLTVIHIGKLSRIIEAVRPHTDLPEADLLFAFDNLASDLQTIIRNNNFSYCRLEPVDYAYFGEHRTTYLIRYRSTAELDNLHHLCLDALQNCLQHIGITQVAAFMAQDNNLKHALTLAPHIAIARSYNGPGSSLIPEAINFNIMPVIY